MMLTLKAIEGPSAGQAFEVRNSATIGRAEGCEVVLEDGAVSREHARITLEGNSIVLEDMESTNGTYVDGAKVSRIALSDGGRFTIGETVFRVSAIAGGTVSPQAKKPRKKSPRAGRPPKKSAGAKILVAGLVIALLAGPTAFFLLRSSKGSGKAATKTPSTRGTSSDSVKAHVETGNAKALHGKAATETPLTLGVLSSSVRIHVQAGNAGALGSDLAAWLKKRQENAGPSLKQSLTKLVDDDEYAHVLVQHEIIHACGEETINDVASTARGKELLRIWMPPRASMSKRSPNTKRRSAQGGR